MRLVTNPSPNPSPNPNPNPDPNPNPNPNPNPSPNPSPSPNPNPKPGSLAGYGLLVGLLGLMPLLFFWSFTAMDFNLRKNDGHGSSYILDWAKASPWSTLT